MQEALEIIQNICRINHLPVPDSLELKQGNGTDASTKPDPNSGGTDNPGFDKTGEPDGDKANDVRYAILDC